MKILASLLGLFWCGISMAQTTEIKLLNKLDQVEEYAPNETQRIKGKHTLLSMLIDCEFDEQCELGMIEKLQNLIKEDANVMYKGFLTYLKWEKADLEYNVKHCQIEEKKQVRKGYAACYAKWMDEDSKNPTPPRAIIDKLESDRQACLKKQMAPLAEQGNIFAEAVMVNVSEYFKDSQKMTFWSSKIQSQKGTPKYEMYMKCSELP
ncbi:MAG: hypothetical protein BGO43_03870 [Gammaproteobacteria bacterium 39-13]|nr:hypothetical protein [Gammaproteobacteria bacterium]OJV96010.1 MAG: hypothetical protein BGO43_03870 [Gammaproteobacteria bacterium 39-13]